MLPKRTIEGATIFVAHGQPAEPAAAVTCVACKQTFVLSPNQPGAFCACGDLHWYDLVYDGSLGRNIPMTEVLHNDEIDGPVPYQGPSDEPNV